MSDERATPLDGLTDWLSWSDIAVVATITGDGLAPEQPTDEPGPEGSKTLLRDAHATVDEVTGPSYTTLMDSTPTHPP